MRRGGSQKTPSGWRGSAAQIAVGRAAIIKWNRGRHLKPKCGARRKSDSLPCEQIAMKNGRCAWHGGKVPRGDRKWHRPVWPHKDSPGAMTKLNRKLDALQRAAAKREKRLKRMSADELAKYRAWQKSHQPGSAAARARTRRERKDAKAMRELVLKIEQEAALDAAIYHGEGVFG